MDFKPSPYTPESGEMYRCCKSYITDDFDSNPSTPVSGMIKTPRLEKLDLIEMVNDLQNKLCASGHPLNVSLPQIVVIGSQSSGKSSVLENIVGREFLPRGFGVVTRRPTIVQLYPSKEEYAVFLHKPEEKYTNFSEVRDEIQRETIRKVGTNAFSSDPINIQIYSPNVLKLTLVDLPGLIKNPVGSQSDSVVEEIQTMVESYITQPQSLILAVSPANQDIANSHSLNIAKKVDPRGERTIGVLTKLDIMDEGTDALDILENRVLPLKRGYVGVINRSQIDIDEGKDITYILKKEESFFKRHSAYSKLANRMGTPYLQEVLNKQLKSHILQWLPQVRNSLFKSLTDCKEELKELSYRLGDNGEVTLPMIRLIQQFIDKLNLKLVGQSELIDLNIISSGAFINYLVCNEVQAYFNLDLKPSDHELMVAMANINGFRSGISLPSLSLDAICRTLSKKYKEPAERAVEAISKVVVDTIEESANEVNMYPSLKNELLFTVIVYVKNQENRTKEILRNHIEAEMYFINLNHPDFCEETVEAAPSLGPIRKWQGTDDLIGTENKDQTKFYMPENSGENKKSGDFQATMLKKLQSCKDGQEKLAYISAMISKYLEIVHKTVSDITIKYVIYFLVKQVIEFTRFELTGRLITSENASAFMRECEEEIQRKQQLENTCEAIGKALASVQRF